MKTKDFHVGQKVFFVPMSVSAVRAFSTEIEEHVVMSVGRKWVTAGPEGTNAYSWYRFLPDTMLADGKDFGSTVKYFLSKEAFYEELEVERLWREIRYLARQLPYFQPAKLTKETAQALLDMLKTVVNKE